MNPQNPTPAEALRKAAHFLRSLRAQSTSEENWQGCEPFAAETLQIVEAALALPPVPPELGAPELEFIANNFSDEAADVAGAEIADGLKLPRSLEHKDRWITDWGTKTARGLARTLLHIIAQAIAPGAQAAPGASRPAAAPVRVLVHIEGGIVDGVISDRPVEWLAIDTEDFNPRVADEDQTPFAPGGELARLTASPGAVHVGKFRAATVSPAAVAELS